MMMLVVHVLVESFVVDSDRSRVQAHVQRPPLLGDMKQGVLILQKSHHELWKMHVEEVGIT